MFEMKLAMKVNVASVSIALKHFFFAPILGNASTFSKCCILTVVVASS